MTPEEEMVNKNMSDHDMLLVLHTVLQRVVIDIKDLKDNTVGRIINLEDTKVNKTEAAIEAARLEGTINLTAKTLSDSIEHMRADYEARLRTLETAKTEVQTQIKNWVVFGGAVWTVVIYIITNILK